MKRKICLLLVFCLILSLSACGVPQEDYDAMLEENKALQAQVEELKTEVELLTLEAEREENNLKSPEITSGVFYDSVSKIHSNIALKEVETGISITIYLKHENELKDSTMFFEVVNKIIETCQLEDYYSDVSFLMFVDDSFVSILTLVNYESPSSFSATEPLVIKEEYKDSIGTLYSIAFSSNDVLNTFDKNLKELQKKYNISN